MKACICRRSASGMTHHGRRRVAILVREDRAGSGGGGLAEYMIQWIGRGAIFPISISKRNRRAECIAITYPSDMSSPEGSSRRQRQMSLRKSQTAGQRPTDATHTKNRSNKHQATTSTIIWENSANTAGQQQTTAAAAAIPTNQALIPYKLATFHTIDRDNSYLYPF